MKKLLAKLIALPLSLVAAFGCFALTACSDDSGTKEPEESNNTTPPEEQTPEEQPPVVTTPSDEDDEDEEEEEAWPLAAGRWVEKEYVTAAESADGSAHSYAVFVPASYDGNTALPLFVFMGDAGATTKPVNELYSGSQAEMALKVAASEQVQAIQSCFVLAIDFPAATGNGGSGKYETYYDYNWGEAYRTVEIVNDVCEDYNVNTNKMYLTGQSAGGMAEFEINYRYPNMFAATYYVSCHWALERVQSTLFRQTWLFTSSVQGATEDKYQTKVQAALDEENLDYSYVLVSAKSAAYETSNSAIKNMLAEGNSHNFIQFEEGTLSKVYGTGYQAAAHNQTWDSDPGAYTFLAVYEWLFRQELDPDNPITLEYSAEYDEQQQAAFDAQKGSDTTEDDDAGETTTGE